MADGVDQILISSSCCIIPLGCREHIECIITVGLLLGKAVCVRRKAPKNESPRSHTCRESLNPDVISGLGDTHDTLF